MGERQITPCRQSLSEEFEIKGTGEGREIEGKREGDRDLLVSSEEQWERELKWAELVS